MFTIIIPKNATLILHRLSGDEERAYWLDSSGRPMKTTTKPADFGEVVVSQLAWEVHEIGELVEAFAEIDPLILQHASNRDEFAAAQRLLLAVRAEIHETDSEE